MKKIVVLISILTISLSTVSANESIKQNIQMQQNLATVKMQREKAFENRLSLTDEQKLKAKEIRIKGHEKIKPVIEEIKAKKQETKMIKMSRIAVQVQEERLAAIDAELKVLEKQAHDIRKANMKEFESILTKDQKKILKQMKKEGRKKYQAEHPYKMPMMQMPVKK
jgi:hypothetical protein